MFGASEFNMNFCVCENYLFAVRVAISINSGFVYVFLLQFNQVYHATIDDNLH